MEYYYVICYNIFVHTILQNGTRKNSKQGTNVTHGSEVFSEGFFFNEGTSDKDFVWCIDEAMEMAAKKLVLTH